MGPETLNSFKLEDFLYFSDVNLMKESQCIDHPPIYLFTVTKERL